RNYLNYILHRNMLLYLFFFSSRRRHTRWPRDWSSDVCSSDLDCRQMITVNGPADHFRNHVVRCAEPDRAEPEKEQIVRVPPTDCRLQNSLHRHDKEHQLPGRV